MVRIDSILHEKNGGIHYILGNIYHILGYYDIGLAQLPNSHIIYTHWDSFACCWLVGETN